jgi:hypothetical protein
MANTIQLLRSTTAGNKPSSLASGQIAINERDAVIYYRDAASGAVTALGATIADGYTYDCGAYSAIVPAAPTGISGTPGVGTVALSWTAPTNTGGVALTDYVVQYSTDQSSWTTFADGTSTATTATVTGLTGGTNYYFRVAAANSVGTGAYATSSVVTPSASKLTIARSNGTSTFTGAGTAASPFTRATRVKNNVADTVMPNGYYLAGTGYTGGYSWTALTSGTVYVTFTFYDDNLDNATGWPRKNGTMQGTDVGDGQTLTARAISVVSGDVVTLYSDSTLASFSNVSVWAV